MIDFFISLLTTLEVIVALLIIVVILLQRSKSGGGLGAIGGAATDEVFGSSYGNVLSKTTVILSSFFLVNTLVLAVLQGNAIKSQSVSIVESMEDPGETTIQVAPEENPSFPDPEKDKGMTPAPGEEKSQNQASEQNKQENSEPVSDKDQSDSGNIESKPAATEEASNENNNSLPKVVPGE